MFALALIAPLVIASTDNCYLVTSERIEPIPCNFEAAVTDALRYAANAEAAARRTAEQQRRVVDPLVRVVPRDHVFGPARAQRR